MKFIIKKKITFYDCDPAGIFFYARVFELCHSAYEELIASFSLNYNYWENENFIVPIINSEASYHKPIKYGQTISVEILVSKLKSSSFELEYLCKNENEEKCVFVKTAHVFVDKKTWKKTEVKKEIMEGLRKYEKRE